MWTRAQGRWGGGGGLENRCTVEAPISGHSWDAKIVSVTEAAPLTRMTKYKLKFVWEPGKKGFCQGGRKWSCPLKTRVSVKRDATVLGLHESY